MTEHYDLLVIGAGSGGVAASRRAASHGARVAVIERSRVGGTCVMRGCVPKKLMMYAGDIGRLMESAARFGWELGAPVFHMDTWQDAKARELDRLEDIYLGMLKGAGVTLLRADACIQGPGKNGGFVVKAGAEELTASRLLVATGGRPHALAVPGGDLAVTSDDVLELREVPARVVVLGVGYIGVEFAGILRSLGAQVTMVLRGDAPLRGFDEDLRTRLAASMRARGIELRAGVSPVSLVREGGAISVALSDGAVLQADLVVNATGRVPNTAGLGLDRIGLATREDGSIAVDDYSATEVAGVHAIGDVTNRMNLTPVAIAEGRAFADSVFGRAPRPFAHQNVATAVFSTPPIGTVGLTEAQAAQRGAARIYEAEFRPMRNAFAGVEQRTFMKLVVDDASDRVLGVHMIGDDAPEIIQCLAVAVVAGATKAQFDATVAVHPTTAEEFVLMREAARTVAP